MAQGRASGGLGPFHPPANQAIEPELRGDPPRRRGRELSKGRLASRRANLLCGLVIGSAVCLGLAPWPFVVECGIYLVPLQYLEWAGYALGALALAQWLYDRLVPGPFLYVERGLALITRIRGVHLMASRVVAGHSFYRFHADLEFLDPISGELRTIQVKSPELGQLAVNSGISTTYRVGDYATAVYFPEQLEKTLQLYGFLELRPGLGLIRARPSRLEWTGRKMIMRGLIVFLSLLGVIYLLYVVEKFVPISGDPTLMIVLMSIGAVLSTLGYVIWKRSKKESRPTFSQEAREMGRFRAALRLIYRSFDSLHSLFVPFLIGGVMTFAVACQVNAVFDRSPPVDRPVQIDRMISETHGNVLRFYKIKYHFLEGDRENEEILSTPERMAEFPGDQALAEVHAGCLGWPWVKELHPPGKAR